MRIGFIGKYGRPVTGKTLSESGCGGSESALVYMAREISNLGNEVFVYNLCGDQHGDYDGVKYRDISEFGPALKSKMLFDVLVIFRDLDYAKLFGPQTAAVGIKKRVYWAHDDQSFLWDNPPALKEIGKRLNHLDRVFAVSQWQSDLYLEKFGVEKSKIYITRNGIDPELFLFKDKIQRDPKRLIYTSVPDRGLDILIDIFPAIRERTGAELYVFSSFKIYGMPETDQKVEELFKKAQTVGIKLMAPLPQKDLARELAKSRVMVYPNHRASLHPVFAETSCIAVLEAQAAGTPVITSNRGALPESVLNGQTGIIIPGDPYSVEYKNSFTEAVIELLGNEKKWSLLSTKARERTLQYYPWSLIAREWVDEFSRLISE